MKWVLGVLAIVAVLASGVYVINKNGTEVSPSSDDSANSTSQASQPGGSTTQDSVAGSYVDYSSSAIAEAEGTRLLFFYAPWCPQCRAIEADIKAKGVPEGVTIIKVDYDSNQALRQKYGVTIQTTLVKVDEQGNEISKYVAYNQPNLQSIKDNLL